MKPRDYFQEVSKLIELGFTISQALAQLDIDSRKFYNTITNEQRLELHQLKTSHTGMDPGRHISDKNFKDLHEFFTLQEYA